MAWNDNNNQTPPELDEVLKDFKNKFNSTFGGKSSGNSGASKAAKGSFKYVFILYRVKQWFVFKKIYNIFKEVEYDSKKRSNMQTDIKRKTLIFKF